MKSINPWHFLWIAVVLSEFFTAAANTLQSCLWWNAVVPDLLIIGAIDALFVPLIVAPVILYFTNKNKELSATNELLLKESIERRQIENELRESESRYKSVVEHIGLGISVISLDMQVLSMNGQMKKWFPAVDETDHPLCYRAFNDPPKEDVCSYCPTRKTLRDGHVHEAVTATTAGNEIRYYRIISSPLLNASGTISAAIAIVENITERMKTEEALRSSEAKHRLLFESSQDAIMTLAPPAWRFTSGNPATLAMFRTGDESTFMTASPWQLSPEFQPDGRPSDRKALEMIETAMRRGSHFFEWRHKRLDGEEFPATVLLTRFQLAGQTLLQATVRDITGQRKLEAQLLQAQKMESIGTFAGGIAHDFNNILSSIIGYGHVALMKMAGDDPQRQNIESMLEASDRAAHLTKDLLLFSRRQRSENSVVDLNEVIRKVEKFLKRVIREDIEFKTMLHGRPIPICADSHQLEQVLMNLATNARDAMTREGVFTIRTEEAGLDDSFIAGQGKSGSYAVLTVSDTGSGMDKATQKHIFEPFFTTKEVGKGTGLGLAVVYGIIKQHEGFVNVYSEPGQGTIFRIYLPVVASGAVRKNLTSYGEDDPIRGTETVLVAEDDESLRKLSRTVLAEYGYDVIDAADGEDAVRKFRENKDAIQLLLFDLVMPKMNGKKAYDEIRRLKPDVKIIFTSGYAPDLMQQMAEVGTNAQVIYKPVAPKELLKKVRSVLDHVGTECGK